MLDTYFVNEVKSGKIQYRIIDISQPVNEKIADKYEVSWSSLFVNKWKKGKETKNNLTDFAFSYAKSSPAQFKTGLKKKIDELLKTEIGDGVLQSLLENSNLLYSRPLYWVLLTVVSPCPLATNITAIGFISKDIQSRNRIFWSGILYTLGRVISYTILGFILIPILREGSQHVCHSESNKWYGDVFIAPALILIGLFMLLGNRLNLPKFGFSAGDKTQTLKGSWGSLLLGALFALAFVPQAVCSIWHAYAHGGCRNRRLSAAGSVCVGNRLAGHCCSVDTGLQHCRLGKFYNRIQVFRSGLTGWWRCFYCGRYLLRHHQFL